MFATETYADFNTVLIDTSENEGRNFITHFITQKPGRKMCYGLWFRVQRKNEDCRKAVLFMTNYSRWSRRIQAWLTALRPRSQTVGGCYKMEKSRSDGALSMPTGHEQALPIEIKDDGVPLMTIGPERTQ